MNPKTNPQHRAEPNEATLNPWCLEETLKRVYGVKPAILPGFGKHRAPSVMAAPEAEAEAA